MTIINATQAQKMFGQVLDQALAGEAVVVERYGKPRAVVLDFRRYRQLVESEQELLRARLAAASAAASARATGLSEAEIEERIEQAREEVFAARSRR